MAIITGTNFDDVLTGTAFDDMISGFNGNDTIDGGDGKDMIDGGNGDDTLMGGLGDDMINGGKGSDSLEGNAGFDAIFGGNGADTFEHNVTENGGIIGGGGTGSGERAVGPADVYDGGAGFDTLHLIVTEEEMAALSSDIANFNAQADKSILFSFDHITLDIKNIEAIAVTLL